ncbi:MAG: DedA family protein [Candidatus Paceibacterota bacterium]
MPNITLLLNLLKEFAWLGNWLFFVLAFIESAPFIGVFIPGSSLISIGGFLAYQGYLNTWDIILFSTIGAIIGDFFSYSLGRWGGRWLKNNKLINYSILKHGEDFFREHGNKSVFWGRFFGPIRAIIPFVAGLSKMKQRPFIIFNISSAISWAMLNVFLGYFSGSLIISIFKKWSSGLSLILTLVTIITIIYWFTKKRNQSLKTSFYNSSLSFAKKLHNYNWFIKLSNKYTFIPDFFKETKNAEVKLYGSLLITSFLIITYILILILDVF